MKLALLAFFDKFRSPDGFVILIVVIFSALFCY